MPDSIGPPDQFAMLHTRISDDENLRAALSRVAVGGCQLLEGCTAASVTLIERGRPSTTSWTSDTALALDRAQYDADAGPCLDAARQECTIIVPETADEHRWPAFRDAALLHAMHSSLSVPLQLTGETKGGLNIYGAAREAFDAQDAEVLAAFAAQASIVVANAQAYWQAFEATRHLTQALENRAVIEQAKGVLIARHGYTDDEAFDELRRRSQTSNRKLRDVATDIVQQARDAGR